MSDLTLFSGNATPELANEIAKCLYTKLSDATVDTFSDGEVHVQINECVRGCDTFIIQSTCAPTAALRSLRFCLRTVSTQEPKANILTTKTITEAKALISGLKPRRTLEKISIGRVVELGPATKLVITKSSIDMVNDNRKAAISAGIIAGRIITKNTFKGPAPKSLAASSIDTSSSTKRERMTTVA